MVSLSLKQRLERKGYVLNGYSTIPSAVAAEFYARQGWDCVTIDLQHGLVGYDSALAILQAITAVDVVPLVRVPWLEPGIIMKMLDAGAAGITCPMINNADDARRLVGYCRYPPHGERSTGPLRAALVDSAGYNGYVERANGFINVFAMIETAEAVKNVESILAVPGIDGIYLGPQDLSMSMGKGPRGETLDPQVDAAIETVLRQCRSRGLIAGTNAPNPAIAADLLRRGFRFITLSNDSRALAAQAKRWVDDVRSLAADAALVRS